MRSGMNGVESGEVIAKPPVPVRGVEANSCRGLLRARTSGSRRRLGGLCPCLANAAVTWSFRTGGTKMTLASSDFNGARTRRWC